MCDERNAKTTLGHNEARQGQGANSAQAGQQDRYAAGAGSPVGGSLLRGEMLGRDPLRRRIDILAAEASHSFEVTAERVQHMHRLKELASQHPEVIEILDLLSRLGMR